MGSPFCNGSLFQYQNLIGVLNGGKPVGNHQDSFSSCQTLKCHLNFVLVFRVSESGGLIQQNDGGILEDCPRKSDALLLPAGELDALGSQHRVHALW